MATSDEKIAELSALVTIFRDELPQIQEQLSQIYRALAVQETNTTYIVKQYDKVTEIIENYNSLHAELKKLSNTVEKNIEQIDRLKNLYTEISKHKDIVTEESKFSFIKFLQLAPNVITLIGFLSYIAYVLIINKMNGGL